MVQARIVEQNLAICCVCDYCGLKTDCSTVEERSDGRPVIVMDWRKAPSPDCPRCGGPMDPTKVLEFANKMALKEAKWYGPGVGRIVTRPKPKPITDEDEDDAGEPE